MAGRHRRQPPPRRWLLPAALGVVLLVALGVGLALGLPAGSGGGASRGALAAPTAPATGRMSATPAIPSSSPVSPAPASSPAARASATPSAAPSTPAPTLALTVTGAASWVQVRVPGGPVLVAQTLPHGKQLRFAQPALDVVLGDAGAVRLTVHGQVHAPAGQPGQVLRVSVRP